MCIKIFVYESLEITGTAYSSARITLHARLSNLAGVCWCLFGVYVFLGVGVGVCVWI